MLISHAIKVMLKILQARFQWYMNEELPDVSYILKRQRKLKSNCQHPLDHRKSKGSPKKKKTKTSASFTMLKPLTVWITINCGKFFKRWEHQTTLPPSWDICMQVKEQKLELDMVQQTGSKLGKEYIKAVYCHPVYLTYMQSTSCKRYQAGWSTGWNHDY